MNGKTTVENSLARKRSTVVPQPLLYPHGLTRLDEHAIKRCKNDMRLYVSGDHS